MLLDQKGSQDNRFSTNDGPKINVGILLSYDYDFLKYSLPCIYPYSNTITLALDEKMRTWSGNTFTIDEAFFQWLENFDTEKKISIYRDDFYDPSLGAMGNEIRERNMLSKKMGRDFWIHIDSDEYVLNFGDFVEQVKRKWIQYTGKGKLQFCGYLISLYKRTQNGFLFFNELDPFYFGTNTIGYTAGRKNGRIKKVYVPMIAIHQSWARSEEEIAFKIKNWGHNTDFDTQAYFEKWKRIGENNYREFKSLHPFSKSKWKRLSYIEADNVEALIQKLQGKKVGKFNIAYKNLGQLLKRK